MNKICSFLFFACISFLSFSVQAQQERWQQAVEYEMEIDMNHETHKYKGLQRLKYYNNSNEELNRVFYHLYFNAFQPGSNMDQRSKTISDPDPRVGARIAALKPEEQGYIQVQSLLYNGKAVKKFETVGTILEVELETPIPAGGTAEFVMNYEAQVPLQIRRSGRNSSEGIDYSMSQWYPKICEYDYQGWHATPYVGREFHGVWGDFDVKITMDAKYIIGATGYLQNANEIGHGYEEVGQKVRHKEGDRITWHFKAPMVHDFVWGADPDYIHDIVEVDDSLRLHFLYQDDAEIKDVWKKVQPTTAKAFKFIQGKFGAYPYKQYSIIQGGDGGMEYPMATLITGKRAYGSLLGVIVHEVMHTWYQMLMATNESLYAWMDEGFTSYASNIVMNYLNGNRLEYPHEPSYRGYCALANSGVEEPLTTHSDYYQSNFAYGQAAYSKGAVFLHQLEYVVGKATLEQILLDYYEQWRFKHPNVNDFIRVAERRSGLELDWYKEYFVYTTHTIDFGVKEVEVSDKDKKSTRIAIERIGKMIMPVDVLVTYTDRKSKEELEILYHIPLDLMRGAKADEKMHLQYEVLPRWFWTYTDYEFEVPIRLKDIKSIVIDPKKRMADCQRENNEYKP